MQKILFDCENTQTITDDAKQVSSLYTEISGSSLSKIELLNSLAFVFGYKNWAELRAVNRSKRYYLPFQLSSSSNMRAIIDELIEHLDVDKRYLMSAVTFAELGVSSLKEKQPDHGSGVIWFSSNSLSRNRFLAQSKLAAVFMRQAITFQNFSKLYPELSAFLKEYLSLAEDCALMFDQPTWWAKRDRLINEIDDPAWAFFEIQIQENHKAQRTCYSPVYSILNKSDSLISDAYNYFSDFGLPYCPVINILDESESMQSYILRCLKSWGKNEQIAGINLLIPEDKVQEYKCSSLNFLNQYLKTSDGAINRIYTMLSSVNFDYNFNDFELRQTYQKDGKASLYTEKWLSSKDAQAYISVNQAIKNNLKKISRKELVITGALQQIERYWQAGPDGLRFND